LLAVLPELPEVKFKFQFMTPEQHRLFVQHISRSRTRIDYIFMRRHFIKALWPILFAPRNFRFWTRHHLFDWLSLLRSCSVLNAIRRIS